MDEDTSKLFIESIKKHIDVEHPLLRERVDRLERRQDKVDEIQNKVVIMEAKISTIGSSVESLNRQVQDFVKSMSSDFTLFKDGVNKGVTRFIFWFIATVFGSLVLGLAFQFKAFDQVNNNIYSINSRLMADSLKNEFLVRRLEGVYRDNSIACDSSNLHNNR